MSHFEYFRNYHKHLRDKVDRFNRSPQKRRVLKKYTPAELDVLPKRKKDMAIAMKRVAPPGGNPKLSSKIVATLGKYLRR